VKLIRAERTYETEKRVGEENLGELGARSCGGAETTGGGKEVLNK